MDSVAESDVPEKPPKKHRMTLAPWEVHEERQADGSVGYHVAATINGEHVCVGTFHRRDDAEFACVFRNAIGNEALP